MSQPPLELYMGQVYYGPLLAQDPGWSPGWWDPEQADCWKKTRLGRLLPGLSSETFIPNELRPPPLPPALLRPRVNPRGVG